MAETATSITSTPRGTCQLPFLPGYAAQEVKFGTARKPQTLSFGPGGSIDSFHRLKKVPMLNMALTERLKDPFHRYDMSYRAPTHDEREFIKYSERNTFRPLNEPAWMKHDRHVLRFDAYTQDRMFESTKETFRIRCCVIYFYLEDGTMMVSEPKVENSGMAQGTIVKRHKMPKPKCLGGGIYSYEDFRVGSTVSIYAQIYKLIACDAFTRKFYWEAMGVTQPDDQDPPIDSFQANMQVDEEAITERSATLSESKEYHHLAAGGNRKNQKLEQYLENDRKVLRFHCFWDDMTKYGTRMYYTLHYYLADDTAEILENMSRNSGRDPYPTFWRRSPLRKNPNITATPGMLEPEPVIYKPEDLVVGEFVNVLSRKIFLYDCDVFTRDFYKEYMDFEQGSIKIEQPRLVHTKIRYPPHIGFGSEEDSLASCLRLTPRPPLRDMKRLIADADKVMRFEAKLANDVPQDEKRRFVVAVFMADDSVGVWELKSRNSGHDEGKFANKARRKNPATGSWFCQADFFVGAIVEVNACPFQLIWADDAAFVRMETHPVQFPYADASLVVQKMRPAREVLEKVQGVMDWRSFQSLAKDHGIQLVDHEAICLAREHGRYQGPPSRKAEIDVGKVLLAMDDSG